MNEDTNDVRKRLRPASLSHPPRYISDIRVQQRRRFPNIRTTLPAYSPQPRPGEPAEPSLELESIVEDKPAAVTIQKQRRHFITKKRIIVVIVLILLVVSGWVGGKLLYNAIRVFHGNIFSILTTTKLNGEDTGRVNILLAGYSVDDPQNTGGTLTDSIMLVSIDVKNNTAFLLSVPRDLYVNIPGYGYGKVNEVYEDGQNGHFKASGYPNGGMGLLEEVVSHDLGISLDYYVLLDNNAVKQAVDAVGGITIDIQSPDPRGIYDAYTHLKLPNGWVTLNGQQALSLARARGDNAAGDVSYGLPGSDFDRTAHQRQMIQALEQKALSTGVLANPIRLGQLFDAFGSNVQTDLTLGNARRLYDLSKTIKSTALQSYGLNSVTFDGRQNVDLLANYWTPNGEEALIPAAGIGNYGQIQLLVQQITSDNPVVREAASVVVLNGTSTAGLATKVESALTAKGINVVAVGNAQASTTTTTIIDASSSKMPATLQLLQQLYGKQVTTTNPYANIYTADFIIVVGTDQVSSLSSSNAQ